MVALEVLQVGWGCDALNALVAWRNFTNASMPSVVPMMSDMTRSSEADLRIWHCSPYMGQVAMMWSRD